MPTAVTIEDHSNYDASEQSNAEILYNEYKQEWMGRLELLSSSTGDAVAEEFRQMFEYFRAAEQVGDAYFFSYAQFIDDDIVREHVPHPTPRLRPRGAVGEAWTISPEYSDRLFAYLGEHEPELVEYFRRIATELQANPVIRWHAADWLENNSTNSGPRM